MTVRHIAIRASELRQGDLMRVGSSTNYVLVYSAVEVDGRIAVTIYSGDVANENGPTLFLDPTSTVDLSPHGTNDRLGVEQPEQRIFVRDEIVQIQDRDRDPKNYPLATVVAAQYKGNEFGYLVRYDNDCVVWVRDWDVLAPRS